MEREEDDSVSEVLRDRFRLSTISIVDAEVLQAAKRSGMEISEPVVACISDLAFKFTDAGNDADVPNSGGYHSVAIAYGNPDETTEQKSNDAEPVCLIVNKYGQMIIAKPPTEKIHQIIARTAAFVAKHGGQSEIVLRVKQGDNPMFGFLMPDHHLHAYFRFLVDHQELLKQDTHGVSAQEEKKNSGGLDQTGGALSLLGSVYGSGEDEDDMAEDASDLQKLNSQEAVDAIIATVHGSEQKESTGNVTGKNDTVSKFPCPPLKEKVNLIKHNRITSTVKGGATSGMKKESDASGSLSTAANKSQAPALPSASKVELPILEPPSDQRRVVEKIVEFILKNGREFEAILAEQNCKQGRFLFLLPSNQYHPYYLKVLQDAQELHWKLMFQIRWKNLTRNFLLMSVMSDDQRRPIVLYLKGLKKKKMVKVTVMKKKRAGKKIKRVRSTLRSVGLIILQTMAPNKDSSCSVRKCHSSEF